MLINCNSCHKKFTVPDSAIKESGRLLQCGSCGNKWTQYPIEKKSIKNIKKISSTETKQNSEVKKVKISAKKKKREIGLYSEEYLKKKYGLTIGNSSNYQNKKNKNKISFGFYNYIITISIFLVALFGFLDLSEKTIIMNFPTIEPYIKNLYQIIDIIRMSIYELLN